MILRSHITRAIASQRHGFSLMEILVVVAIMLILASVAGVYFFGYFEDTEIKTGRTQCKVFEDACNNYFIMNKSYPPDLLTLCNPEVGQPLVSGGANAINSPFGTLYTLQIVEDPRGNPDAIVTFQDRKGATYGSEMAKRKYPNLNLN